MPATKRLRREISAWTILLLCLGAIYAFIRVQSSLPAEAAANDVILLWDGTTSTIPAGWTCVSCRTTDGAGATSSFMGVFPMASSSYANATSGADSVTHTLAFSASTTGLAVAHNSNTGGTAFPRDTHTHSWGNPTLRAESILPPYMELIFIKATSPTQIPKGVIAMFDVDSSALPADWTYYSAMENRYLRGDNATSTGGSATAAATTTARLISGNSAGAYTDAGSGLTTAGPTHNHAIATGSALNADLNQPSYIGVVFAESNTTTSIPTGLIAFFDAAPPSGWNSLSTSGSAWSNRLIIGSSTFGNTGGATTHNHGGTVTWTSTGPSATAATKSGTLANTADSGHTHDVTYTVSTATSLPVNRGVIIGQKLASFLTQANYRWYQNADSSNPTSSLANLNSSTTITDGTVLRLRMNVGTVTSSVSQLTSFKLQFATSTGGPWSDVGLQASTSELWIGYDNTNATTTDGITLSSVLLTSSTVAETYEEENPSAGTPNNLAVNAYGEWDWVLKANGVAGNTNYFFRMVYNDSTPTTLNSYYTYPALTTQSSVTCSTDISSTSFGTLSPLSVSTATLNASTTMSCGGGLGCTLSVSDAGNGTNPGMATTSPAYLIPSATATLVPGTEGYGIQATTTAAGSGGMLGINSIYNITGNDVGGLSTTTVTLASSTAAVTGREVVVTHLAAISGTTPPGSYGDTITYSCVGNP